MIYFKVQSWIPSTQVIKKSNKILLAAVTTQKKIKIDSIYWERE